MRNIERNDVLVTTNGIGAMYERPATDRFNDIRAAVELKAEELLALPYESARHGRLYRTYTLGSVVSYALRNGDDPVEAVDNARNSGHELVYIFGNGVTLSASKMEPKKHILVHVGMLVRFEGRTYELIAQPNSNLGLKFVPAEKKAA
jgi:hypothetical protein